MYNVTSKEMFMVIQGTKELITDLKLLERLIAELEKAKEANKD